jgi:hypothetical protein
MNLPNQPSEAIRKRNPHIYGVMTIPFGEPGHSKQKRLRQSAKPRLNKLESEFAVHLRLRRREYVVTEQAITFRLANGVNYRPDFVIYSPYNGQIIAYETKGDYVWDDAAVKLKVAAQEYPFISWRLAWKEKGEWNEQTILP